MVSAWLDQSVLAGEGLDVFGRDLEKLVGQMPQGPGDRDLIPDLGTGMSFLLR